MKLCTAVQEGCGYKGRTARASLLCSVGKIFHCVHYLSAAPRIILPSTPVSSRWSLFPEVSPPKLRIHLSSPRRERDGCKFEYAMTVTGLEVVPDGRSVREG